jgi:hypothetical protein
VVAEADCFADEPEHDATPSASTRTIHAGRRRAAPQDPLEILSFEPHPVVVGGNHRDVYRPSRDADDAAVGQSSSVLDRGATDPANRTEGIGVHRVILSSGGCGSTGRTARLRTTTSATGTAWHARRAAIGGRPVEELIFRTMEGDIDLILLTYPEGPPPSPNGVITAFDTPDLPAFQGRLLDAGGTVVEPIKWVEFGVNRMQIGFFADPEGFVLEVMER